MKWLIIEKEKNDSYSVIYMESLDEGDEEFIDIYEFSTLDPDESFGEINSFSTFAEALDFSIMKHGATMDKFVNSGIIQDEYLEYINSKK